MDEIAFALKEYLVERLGDRASVHKPNYSYRISVYARLREFGGGENRYQVAPYVAHVLVEELAAQCHLAFSTKVIPFNLAAPNSFEEIAELIDEAVTDYHSGGKGPPNIWRE
jgi:hypothetical protein